MYGDMQHRYWNSNGMGMAIVAVEGAADDWAAYIGALPDPATEQLTVEWTRAYGCKLSEREALAFFPYFPTQDGDEPGERLVYRD